MHNSRRHEILMMTITQVRIHNNNNAKNDGDAKSFLREDEEETVCRYFNRIEEESDAGPLEVIKRGIKQSDQV